MDYVAALRDFQRAVFNKSGLWPADIGQTFIPDNEASRLREYLHNEEIEELNDVLIGRDEDTTKAHLLKEICDVLYVVFGTAVCYFDPEVIEEAFKRVHENNLLKITNGTVLSYGKFQKAADHPKVVLTDLTGEDRALVKYEESKTQTT